jgi:hypothetical protein
MATTDRHPTEGPATPAGSAPVRIVTASRREDRDPPEAWESPASEADLAELSTRRFERLPHRPASATEVPARALDALRLVVGDVGLEQLFVIPRSTRTVGSARADWVLTPTEVIAVGSEAMGVWIDDADGPRVRALVPLAGVVAVLDRTVLLHGRLELVGPERSIIVRYNTVGRPELRELLLPVRTSSQPVAGALPEGIGHDPATLPHKWMALVRSSDVQPAGPDRLVVAAGDLWNPKPQLHDGVAVLSSRELLVATDPTPDIEMAHYGVDLLAVARSRVRTIGGGGDTLVVTVADLPRDVEIRVSAHPALVAETIALLGPLVGTARS